MPRRWRRPLVALIVLLVLLAIGYGVHAARGHGLERPGARSGATSQPHLLRAVDVARG